MDVFPDKKAAGAFAARARNLARPGGLPDRPDLDALASPDLAELAGSFGLDLRRAEEQVLALGMVPAKYLKNIPFYGLDGQAALLGSRAALVGLGGLGGGVLECLLRLGVGRVRVADGDRFEESNANRQLLCTARSLGRGKAEAARERAAEVNPACVLEVRPGFLDAEGFGSFLEGAGVALDALGGLDGRMDLARAASRAGVPLVAGAINGMTGLVAVVAPGGPSPFAFMGGAGGQGEGLGSPAPSAMAVGAAMAAQAAEVLAGRVPSLTGKMLAMDLARGMWDTLTL